MQPDPYDAVGVCEAFAVSHHPMERARRDLLGQPDLLVPISARGQGLIGEEHVGEVVLAEERDDVGVGLLDGADHDDLDVRTHGPGQLGEPFEVRELTFE